MTIDIATIFDVAEKVTTIGVLLLVSIGFMYGKIVPEYVYREMKEDRDYWRASNDTAKDLAKAGLDVAKKS